MWCWLRRAFGIYGLCLLGLMSCQKEPGSGDSDEAGLGVFKEGMGTVVFNDYAPLKDKPVRIYYYIPEGIDIKDCPILLVFHGTNRNANNYLDAWITYARDKKVLVFAPEFSTRYFDEAAYNLGGVKKGDVFQPEAMWTFSIVEPIFDFIRSNIGSNRSGYDMYGHSAGSQFVHRFLMFKSRNSVERAVLANAGWYTVPDEKVAFPFGIKNSSIGQTDVREFFEKKVYLTLGTKDTDPNAAGLNTSAGAMNQGRHRYERGNYFWDQVQILKTSKKYTLNWEFRDVLDVGHDHRQMTAYAAEVLYP